MNCVKNTHLIISLSKTLRTHSAVHLHFAVKMNSLHTLFWTDLSPIWLFQNQSVLLKGLAFSKKDVHSKIEIMKNPVYSVI